MSREVLCVIPARSGSKGLPQKNILPLSGLPLIAHSILCARMTGSIDRTVVSTDSDQIAGVAKKYGADVPFFRPPELARDETPSWPVFQHALRESEAVYDRKFDRIAVLQPTNPARRPRNIETALDRLAKRQRADGVIGIAEPDFHIDWQSVEKSDGFISHVFDSAKQTDRRQDARQLYYINGLLYVFERDFVLENDGFLEGDLLGLQIDRERSIDIDTQRDLEQAEFKISSGYVSLPWIEPAPQSKPPDRSSTSSRRDHISIGDRLVGDGLPCFIIGEAGVNHNGDPERAFELVDAAAAAGVDAVKFQTFVPEKLVSPEAEKADYQAEKTGEDQSQLEMLDKLALPMEVFRKLKTYAEKKGLVFLSTPFDPDSAAFLDKLGVVAFKIGSGELTNLPLLREVSSFGRPMLVSTGMAQLSEVRRAVDAIESNRTSEIALFHCVSNYPTNAEDSNLQVIETLRRQFGAPVGWSDHTLGTSVTVASIGAGADLIEKHFTLDKNLPGPDHDTSLEPRQLEQMVSKIRRAEAAVGHGSKHPFATELETAKAARKSICAARDLEAGETLSRSDLEILRPGTGIAPRHIDSLVGRTVEVDIGRKTPLERSMFEGNI